MAVNTEIQGSRAWRKSLLSWALQGAYACVGSSILIAVNQQVPQPYMDEPFHVGQTLKYCEGDFQSWDPKITTFPGLYVLGTAWGRLHSQFTACTQWAGCCGATALRGINLLLAILLYDVLLHLHRQVTPSANPHQVALLCLTLALFPPYFFSSFLYYTDTGATLLVMACHLAARQRQYRLSAVLAAAAVAFRQTNAVWACMVLLDQLLVLASIDGASPSSTAKSLSSAPSADNTNPALLHGRSHPPAAVPHAPATARPADSAETAAVDKGDSHAPAAVGRGLFADLLHLLTFCYSNIGWLLALVWPMLLVPAAFAVFVVVNGGVTVGDREAHRPVPHLAHPLYFALFTLGAALPLWLSMPALACYRRALGTSRPLALIAGAVLSAAAFIAAVRYGTFVHPYLLADNRHYTFYLWRRTLGLHPAVRYLLVPAYVIAWSMLSWRVRQARSALWLSGFIVCLVATLVPAGLIEFRYFIVPFFLLLLHCPPPPWQRSASPRWPSRCSTPSRCTYSWPNRSWARTATLPASCGDGSFVRHCLAPHNDGMLWHVACFAWLIKMG